MTQRTLAVEASQLEEVRGCINGFLGGREQLTGLDLYYRLEASTPLRDFHLMLRPGTRNRSRSGLQQSYGDHNRLLLLGLDRMIAGDLAWYRSRLEAPGSVTDEQLCACFESVRSLGLDAAALTALWVGGAFHDCGMLSGRASDVDVEDGVVLAAELVDALCPARTAPLALFAIRNHDYIKQVVIGEVPPGFISAQIAELPTALQSAALVVLGMVQVAGAASLGEGRLTPFRMNLFARCAAGHVLTAMTPVARLAALLGTGEDSTSPPPTEIAEAFLHSLPEREAFERFLARAMLHRWHRVLGSRHDASTDVRTRLLCEIAHLWEEQNASDHLVLSPTRAGAVDDPLQVVERQTLLNGQSVLVIG